MGTYVFMPSTCFFGILYFFTPYPSVTLYAAYPIWVSGLHRVFPVSRAAVPARRLPRSAGYRAEQNRRGQRTDSIGMMACGKYLVLVNVFTVPIRSAAIISNLFRLEYAVMNPCLLFSRCIVHAKLIFPNLGLISAFSQ